MDISNTISKSDLRQKCLAEVTKWKETAKLGQDAETKLAALTVKRDEARKQLAEYTETAEHVKNLYKNFNFYLDKHQEQITNLFNKAMAEAAALVPAANADGVHLEVSNGGAVIVDKDGSAINRIEGGAYQALLGLLLRYVCLKSQPGALPFMALDEYFFTLSDVTAEGAKSLFEALKKTIGILIVEQRRFITSGIEDRSYTVVKTGNKSEVSLDESIGSKT